MALLVMGGRVPTRPGRVLRPVATRVDSFSCRAFERYQLCLSHLLPYPFIKQKHEKKNHTRCKFSPRLQLALQSPSRQRRNSRKDKPAFSIKEKRSKMGRKKSKNMIQATTTMMAQIEKKIKSHT
jgi:hypothetical protein